MAPVSTNRLGRILAAGSLLAAAATAMFLLTTPYERREWRREVYGRATSWREEAQYAQKWFPRWRQFGERCSVEDPLPWRRAEGTRVHIPKEGTLAIRLGDDKLLLLDGPHAYETLRMPWRRSCEDLDDDDRAVTEQSCVLWNCYDAAASARSGLRVFDARHTNLDTTVARFARERHAWQACPQQAAPRKSRWWKKLAVELGPCSGLVPASAPPEPARIAAHRD
jgi:hypothetical protein